MGTIFGKKKCEGAILNYSPDLIKYFVTRPMKITVKHTITEHINPKIIASSNSVSVEGY